MPIPVYLKTSAETPRPTDAEFYWCTRNGMFLCRNHAFFQSDVPAQRHPAGLAEHQSACTVRYPLLPEAALEYAVGFFSRVYQEHCSEAIVLVLWDLQRQRYRLWIPRQYPSVWVTSGGLRTAMDVRYDTPTSLPPHHLLVADIHSHADMAAYASYTDKHDEIYRDGVHLVVGHVELEPPEFHLELSIDGCRFGLQFEHFLKGYRRRRRIVPQRWLDEVTVKVDGSKWSSWSSQTNTARNYGTYDTYTSSDDMARDCGAADGLTEIRPDDGAA